MNPVYHRMQGVADLAPVLYNFGIREVVICPGSRNVPLINSLVTYNKFNYISLVDERSAAYFALGISQFSGNPVAIVSTSGTAVLNLSPAIAEAFYQGLPLVAITADRPAEWIDQADGQAIKQLGVFSNFVKIQVNLPVETINEDDLWNFKKLLSVALNSSIEEKAGPVHINIPLREPLYDILPELSLKSGYVRYNKSLNNHIDGIEYFKTKWNSYNRKMIIAGVNAGNEHLNEVLKKLSSSEDTVIIAENISNFKGDEFISSPEVFFASLSDKELKNFIPQLIITVGEGIVSKRLKTFLRENKVVEHWDINNYGIQVPDTYKCLTSVIRIDSVAFLKEISKISRNLKSDYASIFRQNNEKLKYFTADFLKEAEFSDFKVVGEVFKIVPENYIVQLANSTAVRLSQIFQTHQYLKYYSNRGTSGIDGCVSTAAGSAFKSNQPTLLIVSDLAFIYDSNGLWNSGLPKKLKILLLNNEGGNIFRLIKTGEAYKNLSEYIETPHNINLGYLARAYGITYLYAENENEFLMHLDTFFKLEDTVVLEVKTEKEMNTHVIKSFYTELQYEKMEEN